MEEVKDIKPDEKFKKQLKDPKPKGEKRPISQLTANKINEEAVKIDVSIKGSSPLNSRREKINSVIDQINIAVKTTEDISSIFESITGIIEQAAGSATNANRLRALEAEAKGLAEEINKISQAGSLFKEAPEEQEATISEIEKKLSTAFAELFSAQSKKVLSPNDINFNDKSSLDVSAQKVLGTKERLERISQTIKETSEEIRKAIELGEVVVENNEASTVLVRDVEQALEVARKTSLDINNNPTKAMGAIGLKKVKPSLLEP